MLITTSVAQQSHPEIRLYPNGAPGSEARANEINRPIRRRQRGGAGAYSSGTAAEGSPFTSIHSVYAHFRVNKNVNRQAAKSAKKTKNNDFFLALLAAWRFISSYTSLILAAAGKAAMHDVI